MMKYPDGQEVKLGDRVALGQDDRGIALCSIDEGESATLVRKNSGPIY